MRQGLFLCLLVLSLSFITCRALSSEDDDTCTLETCPTDTVISQRFKSQNCTGNYTLRADVPLNNTQCSPVSGNSQYTAARSTCSSTGVLSSRLFYDDSCTNLWVTQAQPVGVCANYKGYSSVMWCSVADVKATTSKLIPSPPTPDTRVLPPATLNGNTTTQGCNITGCGPDYPTTFYYSTADCSGNAIAAQPSNGALLFGINAWMTLDTCYFFMDSPNTTMSLSCVKGSPVFQFFFGDCQAASNTYTYVLPSDQCIRQGNSYYKTVCPASNSASTPSGGVALLFGLFALLSLFL